MIFNFGKRKSIEITNADEIADLLADKLNVKNDEVMLLTQENDEIRRNYDALKNERDDLDLMFDRLLGDYDFNEKQVKKLTIENEKLKEKSYTPAKHKQEINRHKETIKKLSDELVTTRNIAKENQIYRETYEYITTKNKEQKQLVKDVFCHNFNVWHEHTELSNIDIARKYNLDKSLVTDLKNNRVGATMVNIQALDEILCDYFECSVYELVTRKMEGK